MREERCMEVGCIGTRVRHRHKADGGGEDTGAAREGGVGGRREREWKGGEEVLREWERQTSGAKRIHTLSAKKWREVEGTGKKGI